MFLDAHGVRHSARALAGAAEEVEFRMMLKGILEGFLGSIGE